MCTDAQNVALLAAKQWECNLAQAWDAPARLSGQAQAHEAQVQLQQLAQQAHTQQKGCDICTARVQQVGGNEPTFDGGFFTGRTSSEILHGGDVCM